MSTRAHIIYHEGGRKPYRLTYCHCDGYPKGLGFKLCHFYTKADKVRKLLDLGWCSSIGYRLEPGGYAQKPSGHYAELGLESGEGTSAYGRDWEREGEHTLEFPTLEDAVNACNWDIEFLYFGKRTGCMVHWQVANVRECGEPLTLREIRFHEVEPAIAWEEAEDAAYAAEQEARDND